MSPARPARATVSAQAARQRESWRPRAKIRPCLVCNKPRISTSAEDRIHPGCRREGEAEGEPAGLLV